MADTGRFDWMISRDKENFDRKMKDRKRVRDEQNYPDVTGPQRMHDNTSIVEHARRAGNPNQSRGE